MGPGSWVGRRVLAALSSKSTPSEVVRREFRGADKSPERSMDADRDTPLRSRRLDSCDIGESKQFFMTSPMSGAWAVRPQ